MTNIEQTLKEIEARLHQSEGMSDKRRKELQQLVEQLRGEVATLAKTHGKQAETIVGLTHRSTRAATGKNTDAPALRSSLSGLAESVEEFEQSHPKLVQIVNAISLTLSNSGV